MTQANLGVRSTGVSLGPSSAFIIYSFSSGNATEHKWDCDGVPSTSPICLSAHWRKDRDLPDPKGCRISVGAQSVTAYYTTVSLDGCISVAISKDSANC